MNYTKFFGRRAEEVAKDLLGRYLLRETDKGGLAGKIIQTGAYEGGEQTPSRVGMLYAPGTIFIMPFRGNYFLNIATGRKGKPSCVLIRQVALDEEVLNGPGKVGSFFNVQDLDGILMGYELQLLGNPVDASQIKKEKTGTSDNCLGYYSIR